MKTNAEYSGLTHEDNDICECDDLQCSCMGSCRTKADYTMYETDENGNTHPESDSGVRMCSDCAYNAFSNGTHESEEGFVQSNHYDNEFPFGEFDNGKHYKGEL